MPNVLSNKRFKVKIVSLMLFSSSVLAVETCELSWEASVSKNIKHYSIYNKDKKIVDNIIGLKHTMLCHVGVYTVTATNKHGIESIKSATIPIGRPKPPTNFIIKWLQEVINSMVDLLTFNI